VANGSQLVDEKTCEKTKETSCKTVEDPWVTNTGNWPPGILQLEVIVTDANHNTESVKFWVNIPYTSPPNPEAEEPPKFDDVLHFREEHGLDLDLKGNEIAIDERIFNLIGDWYNPRTPNGEVARATDERWGVPLRAVDAAELEYRLAYEEQATTAIPAWSEANAPSAYAGYYVDERAGGIIYIGFTGNQAEQVEALKRSAGLMTPDRIAPYPEVPMHTFSELRSLQGEIASLAGSSQPGLITGAEVNLQDNRVDVGASNVGETTSLLEESFGASAPIDVTYQATARPRRDSRERIEGPIRAGDLIRLNDREGGSVDEKLTGSVCTAGFGAFDQATSNTNTIIKRMFVLTAGHCMVIGHEVMRRSDPSQTQKQWIGFVKREGLDNNGTTTDVDVAAIRLENPAIVPRKIFTAPNAARIPVKSIGVAPGIGTNICYSGITSNRVRCGPIIGPPEEFPRDEGTNWTTVEVCFREYIEGGDSGSPAWIEGTGTAVGIMTTGFDETENAEPEACFEPLKPYSGWGPDSAAFTNSTMAPLHLVTEP
jgi:hypothetical protein